MLDQETKRKINNARDVLVGKVPDPKAQVEQITTALIYKFMYDMDSESIELGGKAQFFCKGLAKYSWPKLMDRSLSGQARLGLYVEGITSIERASHIPPLFRNIFKGAFLPYNDPQTLNLFLKELGAFSYENSENLGNAFEYLLSILGSQGDAGQFRTPRHIIDFIVEVLAPRKDESILDPACGTAGFLISAYKYVYKTNSSNYKPAKDQPTFAQTDDKEVTDLQIQSNGRYKGDKLNPSHKKALQKHIIGYDISPDMVRLSLVNLYLHRFQEPHIYEYDSLTNESRWDDDFDVVLANPPFMTPKGGIRPHKKFQVQANRSELLFVDYIAEHLKPRGRAGIIVPEGIIFQSSNAYKALRKMLVGEYLWAVLSLPAGIFNPYSGVKTSILFLDRSLAKKSKEILFVKVEKDGFGLGAQRRRIQENDLPQAFKILSAWQKKQSLSEKEKLAHAVPIEKIAASGEYNLSGERYRENSARLSHFSIVSLGEVAEVVAGQSPPGKSYNDNGVGMPFYQGKTEFGQMFIGEPTKWTTDPQRFAGDGDILMSVRAPVGPVNLATQKICIGRGLAAIRPMEGHVLTTYIFYVLCSLESEITGSAGAAFASINKGDIESIQIPLPPLEVQREIVAEIEGYQRVIDGARAVIDNYRPQIVVDPEWPMVAIAELTKPEYGFTEKAEDQGDTRFIRITDISEDGMLRSEEPKFITLTSEAQESVLEKGDILVARTGATYGKTMIFEEDYPAVFASYLIRLRFPLERVHQCYYWAFAQSDTYWNQAKALMTGGGQPQFNGNAIKQIKFPLPSLETQQAIVAEIKAEQSLVAANRELVERMEGKIRAAIGRVWGGEDNEGTKGLRK